MNTQLETLITTPRLYLRPVTVEDVGSVYLQALNDPEVVGLTEARHIRWDRQEVLDYIAESNREGTSQLLGIFLKDSDQHIGNVRLFNISSLHRRLELGIMIFDRSQWGKGYGTETLEGVSRYVFEVLQCARICADYYASNAASARIFEKAGFKIEGVFRQHFLLEGRPVDSVRVAKLNEPTVSRHADGAQQPTLIPSNGPSITEREVAFVTEAAREGWYANMSRYVEAFERRFAEHTGMRYALATNNCTAALHLAVLALRLGPGDEVIVPDITWVASVSPVCYVGARPVFVDIDPCTWCITPQAIERALTRRTKAIVAVGLLGNLPDMDAIRAVAARRSIPIIEDAAESIGARYRGRRAGSFGTIGVFSFNGTKLMVTGEGGMFVTDDRRLYQRAKGLRHHGLLMRGARSRFYWSYELGYKYTMTNLQAALGLAQLDRLDELVTMRRRIFQWYTQRLDGLEDVQLNQEGQDVEGTFWIVTAIVGRRYRLTKEQMVRELVRRGIAGRPFFYPLSAMPPFARYGRGKRMARINPVTYAMSPYGICLPSAFVLTEADVDRVCTQFKDMLAGRRRR